MNRLLPKKIIYLIFLIALTILIYSCFITYQQIQRLLIANSSVVQTHQIIEKINSVILNIVDGSRLEQSYLDSKNERYLLSYQISLQNATSDMSDLKQLIASNDNLQNRFARFDPLVKEVIASLEAVMQTNQTSGKDKAMELLVSQKQQAQISFVKHMADEMNKEEFRLLQNHNATLYADTHLSNVIVITAGIVSDFLLLLSFLILSHQEQKYAEEQEGLQKEIEEKKKVISEANHLKSEFLANMSHELLTPLNSVIGYSELIQDGIAGAVSHEQKEYLQEILKSSRHLQHLINDVLDLTQIEAGKINLMPEDFSLPSLIHEVTTLLRPLAARKKIYLTTLIDDNLTTVHIDPVRFKQVLYQYLSNAINFTPELGNVKIHARLESERSFIIEVEDNGIGIKPEDIDKLFVEFQQVDSRDARKFHGTGLGLALTKRIVEAQGGRVGVTSKLDSGSIFYAVLPREQEITSHQS
ncbi:MAG: ATP-binding protein [Gammaproteobacteria bacterium]|nr:ATP-binding protein [Gammaproteobacteria bacterium]